MNFLADESIDRQIVERLRADGHSVTVIEPGRVRIRRSLLWQATESLTRIVKN